jgi:hypothetical protein
MFFVFSHNNPRTAARIFVNFGVNIMLLAVNPKTHFLFLALGNTNMVDSESREMG